MNQIKCKIEGCSELFKTEEAVSANAVFICKNHPRAAQVKANGRFYDIEADNQDKDVSFQEYAFDKGLRRAGKPVGTESVRNQGSDVLTADEVGVPDRIYRILESE